MKTLSYLSIFSLIFLFSCNDELPVGGARKPLILTPEACAHYDFLLPNPLAHAYIIIYANKTLDQYPIEEVQVLEYTIQYTKISEPAISETYNIDNSMFTIPYRSVDVPDATYCRFVSAKGIELRVPSPLLMEELELQEEQINVHGVMVQLQCKIKDHWYITPPTWITQYSSCDQIFQ